MSIGRRSRRQVDKSRPEVFKRDSYLCVADGLFEAVRWPCVGGLTVQHRRTKGMGGSALGDAPEALVTMCSGHNVLQTADADFAKRCVELGWAVPRWVADRHKLSRIPVKYCDGWFLLTDVDRVPISENTAQAIFEDVYGDLLD